GGVPGGGRRRGPLVGCDGGWGEAAETPRPGRSPERRQPDPTEGCYGRPEHNQVIHMVEAGEAEDPTPDNQPAAPEDEAYALPAKQVRGKMPFSDTWAP